MNEKILKIALVVTGTMLIFVLGMFIVAFIKNNNVYSYGLYEKDNVWNRIRVDNKGYVICSKGE